MHFSLLESNKDDGGRTAAAGVNAVMAGARQEIPRARSVNPLSAGTPCTYTRSTARIEHGHGRLAVGAPPHPEHAGPAPSVQARMKAAVAVSVRVMSRRDGPKVVL